jgi:hypothetical protein
MYILSLSFERGRAMSVLVVLKRIGGKEEKACLLKSVDESPASVIAARRKQWPGWQLTEILGAVVA